jgi:transposase
MGLLAAVPRVQSILSLHALGWSYRRIAERLGVHRETVSRYVRLSALDDSKPANAPILAGRIPEASNPASAPIGASLPPQMVDGDSKPANAPILPSGSGRPSQAATWREFILAKRQQGLSGRRIHQDLMTVHGAGHVSYDIVRRLLKQLKVARPLPFRRMECEPGAEAQVDFGTGAPIIGTDHPSGGARKRRKTHVFRIVLSHSRKAYSEASFRQTADDFMRCLENAFWHFGGVPKTLVIDNLKAAVAHPDWFDPELNPKLQSFAQHYRMVILPTKPRTPRHKGKIERGIGYVKDNALKGHSFPALEEENRHLAHWEENVADTRIHGTTKRQVGKVFAEVERPALLPLPAERFPSFHEAKRKVNRDGHIEVARAYYSVPTEFLGREVWARWDSRLVRIRDHRFRQIAIHVRHEMGRFSTQAMHIAPEKISGLERGAAWLLERVEWIGPQAHAWAQAMVVARGIEGTRVLQGLLSLAKKYPHTALEKACETALSHGAFRLRTLRQLLKREGPKQEPLPFLDEHPIIRPLDDYARIVAQAIHRQADRSSMSEGFSRHGWTKECLSFGAQQNRPDDPPQVDRQGAADIPPPRSEYLSSGCTSAEPDSVSPDVPSFSPFHQEHDHA